MSPDGDLRPGTGVHRRGAVRGPVPLALLTVGLLLAAVAGAAVAATPDDPVIVRDPAEGTPGGLELTRVQLARADDGRLRAALTLGRAWRTRDLLGPGEDDGPPGPPGSLCLRLWTRSEPTAGTPDFLVCMTADASGRDLRGSVLTEREGDLMRVAGASLTRSSMRTVIVRFAQSAVGRPATIRFAGEATAPGCAVVTCVDTAPDAPATATLRLRTS